MAMTRILRFCSLLTANTPPLHWHQPLALLAPAHPSPSLCQALETTGGGAGSLYAIEDAVWRECPVVLTLVGKMQSRGGQIAPSTPQSTCSAARSLHAASMDASSLVHSLLGSVSARGKDDESDPTAFAFPPDPLPPQTRSTRPPLSPVAVSRVADRRLRSQSDPHLGSPSRLSATSSPGQHEQSARRHQIASPQGRIIQELQAQHAQRLNEMAEASARIAQQKEEEIEQLTAVMQSALDATRERERAALQRAEQAESERAETQRQHKNDMIRLRGDFESMQQRLHGKSEGERRELAARLQDALNHVREAAEQDIADLEQSRELISQERDVLKGERDRAQLALAQQQEHAAAEARQWQQRAENEAAESDALRQRLTDMESALARAREEITTLSVTKTQELADVKRKFDALARQSELQSWHKEGEDARRSQEQARAADVCARLEEQVRHLTRDLDAAQAARTLLEDQHRNDLEKKEMEHREALMQLENNNSTLRQRLAELQQGMRQLHVAQGAVVEEREQARQAQADRTRLLDLVAQLQHERSLALAEKRALASQTEAAALERAHLEQEVLRLDKLVYGRRRGAGRASSKVPGVV